MELLDNYSVEGQKNIMAEITVVQIIGWSTKNNDQYQFHIILGRNVRVNEGIIKELKKDCEKAIKENNQKVKDFKDLKENLRIERYINEHHC